MINAAPADMAVFLEACRQKLHDTHSPVRLEGLLRLMPEDINPSPLQKEISSCLEDSEENVRQLAVVILAQIGAPAVIALIQALDEKQPVAIRIAAASGLGRIGADAAPAIEPLCKCLHSDDERLRWHASFTLSKLGGTAVPTLQRMLNSSEPKVICAAVNSLEWLGRDAKMAIEDIKKLSSSSPLLIRLACYSSLVKITGDTAQGLPKLYASLNAEESLIRKTCIERIGFLVEIAKEAAPLLLPCLSDSAGEVRAAAALALARIGADQPGVVEGLILLLNDPNPEARTNAGIALSARGPAAISALPALRAMQTDQDPWVAKIAKAAIDWIEKNTGTET
jgi:HEAT repeat protein